MKAERIRADREAARGRHVLAHRSRAARRRKWRLPATVAGPAAVALLRSPLNGVVDQLAVEKTVCRSNYECFAWPSVSARLGCWDAKRAR
jgi:acetolactate synthase regulatory subunit